MATDFANDNIFQAEDAGYFFRSLEDNDSPSFERLMRDANLVALTEQIEKLELLNACSTMLPTVRHDVDMIIATIKRILPALD